MEHQNLTADDADLTDVADQSKCKILAQNRSTVGAF
jgi:hypothetical protein